MKRKVRVKVVEITRQTNGAPRIAVYCSKCGEDAEMVTRIEATAILQTADLELDGLIRGGIVHVVRTVNSTFWICKKSLFESSESSKKEG